MTNESFKKMMKEVNAERRLRGFDLFESPIREKQVRVDVVAYQYRNGIINIAGEKYSGYSMTEAIKIWRSKNRK
jgi:hypothetical protein